MFQGRGTDNEDNLRYIGLKKHYHILGKTSTEKKSILSGIARMRGGGLPMPEFLALFQEVHFWSIKRVYFFKNANVLNF